MRPEHVRPVPVDRLAADIGLAGVDTGSLAVSGITLDSASVVAGDLFAALPGAQQHGARFAGAAVANGAVAVLTDEDGAQLMETSTVPILVVDKPRAVVGPLAATIYDHPSAAMNLVGVTGTNGKTTTTYFLEGALAAAGHRTALLGTIETRIAGERVSQARTTPEAPELQAILALARERGVTAAAMEVSSHALSLGRVAGTTFRAAVFTNLSQDHLDFHESMDAYFAAKLSLFRAEMAQTAVICVDDQWGEWVMERTRLPHVTCSIGEVAWADWHASDVVLGRDGSSFRGRGPAGESVDVQVSIAGAFNVSNALLALAAAVASGVEPRVAAAGIASVSGIPGRLERVDEGQDFTAYVDFAHTPGAVRSLLTALRAVTPGRLVVVLGCGGDRDQAKRPAMARAAAELADLAVFTSDNPRSEDPADILAAMTEGLELPYLVEADRREAIARGLRGLGPGDAIVVAGKGHETGQDTGGIVTPFDDRLVLAELMRPTGSSRRGVR